MAKLSGKHFREVARITTEFGGSEQREAIRYLWVYRSDGRVLRRCTNRAAGSSYTILDKFTDHLGKADALNLLRRIAGERDHQVVKEG